MKPRTNACIGAATALTLLFFGPSFAAGKQNETQIPPETLQKLDVLSDGRARNMISSLGDLQSALASYHVAPCKNLLLTSGRELVYTLHWSLTGFATRLWSAKRVVFDSVENAAKDTAAQQEIEQRLESVARSLEEATKRANRELETGRSPPAEAARNLKWAMNSPCLLVDQILTNKDRTLLIQQLAILTRIAQSYASFRGSLIASRSAEFLQKNTESSGRLIAADQRLFLSTITPLRADLLANLARLEKFQVELARSSEKADQLWHNPRAPAQEIPYLRERLMAAQSSRDHIQRRLDAHIVSTKLFISGFLALERRAK